MTQAEFDRLPMLLRARAVPELSVTQLHALRQGAEVHAVRASAGGKFYYARASVAPLVGRVMDWREFDAMPALLRWKDLLWVGLDRRSVREFVRCGLLRRYRPARHMGVRYPKAEVARMVGRV